MASSALLESVLQWSTSLEEGESEIPLEKCCARLLEMQKHLGSEAVQSMKPDWLDAAKSALSRFEKIIEKDGSAWAKRTWKASGPAEVSNVLECCKHLPQSLTSLLRLAKCAPILDKLEAPPAKITDYDKDLPCLMKTVKKWLTINSLDSTQFDDHFAQETVECVNVFCKSVEESLQSFFTKLRGDHGEVSKLVQKYRLDTFLVCFVCLFVCFCFSV